MKNLIYILTIVAFFTACDKSRVYDTYKHIADSEWHKDSVLSFSFNLQDTLAKNQIFINLRNTVDYPYSNIYLFTRVNFPDGMVLVDTLEYQMTDAEGVWLGEGLSSVKYNKLYFKKDVVFYSTGDYSISVQHGMRDEFLKGISDVGLRIEKN